MKSFLTLLLGCLVFSSHSQYELEEELVDDFTMNNSHHWNKNNKESGNHIHNEFVFDSRIICRHYEIKGEDEGHISISYPTKKGYWSGNLIYWDTPLTFYRNSDKKKFEKQLETIIDGIKSFNDEESPNYGRKKFQVACDESFFGDDCVWIINGRYNLRLSVRDKNDSDGQRFTRTILNQKECEKLLKWLKKNDLGRS